MSSSSPAAFISYSRTDSEFTMRLAADLKAAGANVWLDHLDIKPGHHWDRSIEAALMSATRMLLILSPAAVASENVMDEVSFAIERKKTIVPILLADSDIPFRLRRIQYLDFRTDYARGLRELLDSLDLQQPAPSAPVLPRTPPPDPPASSRQIPPPGTPVVLPQPKATVELEVTRKPVWQIVAAIAILVIAIASGYAYHHSHQASVSHAPASTAPGPVQQFAAAPPTRSETTPLAHATLPQPSPAKLTVTCSRSCSWRLDGNPQASLLPGAKAEVALTPGTHAVEAKPDDPALTPESKTLDATPGHSLRQNFVFAKAAASPSPAKCPTTLPIDALIQSAYNKHLDDDLPAAYTGYSNAQRASLSCGKYRLQDALKGKENVLADCKDRGISCFPNP